MGRNPITKLWHPALGMLLSFAMSAGAHVGDRVYPIAWLNDEVVEEIRLDDGSVDEWYELIGEPTMTLLDFTEEWLEISGQNQRYEAVARTNGPILDDSSTRFYTGSFALTALPPYGEGGGVVAGEVPFISVIELYVTPFNQKGDAWDSVEGAVISDLAAGQIVGFAIAVNDYDPPDIFWMFWAPEADTDSDRFSDILSYRADGFLDGLLLPAEPAGPGGSAVGSVSWGRIKAALEID